MCYTIICSKVFVRKTSEMILRVITRDVQVMCKIWSRTEIVSLPTATLTK